MGSERLEYTHLAITSNLSWKEGTKHTCHSIVSVYLPSRSQVAHKLQHTNDTVQISDAVLNPVLHFFPVSFIQMAYKRRLIVLKNRRIQLPIPHFPYSAGSEVLSFRPVTRNCNKLLGLSLQGCGNQFMSRKRNVTFGRDAASAIMRAKMWTRNAVSPRSGPCHSLRKVSKTTWCALRKASG
jgi:hypothetical protein